MMNFSIKRIYDKPGENDGYRILVDRLWPRGVSKDKAELDEWNKEITPTPELRKWFDHKEERFQEFNLRYREELKAKEDELNRLREIAKSEPVTLLYAAKSPTINHAIILKAVLMGQ